MNEWATCTKLSRRRLLTGVAGSAAFAALARRGDAQVSAAPVRVRNTASAVIFVNLAGGPSHLDTFDPKDAPWNPADADLRQYPGGIVLSRTLFPELSKITNDLCILKSVRSWEAIHDRGQFYIQTAHPANPAFLAESPHLGAVVSMEKSGKGSLPPFLSLSGGTSQGASFLSGRMEPMAAPNNPGGLNTIQHNFFGPNSQQRFLDRYKLMQELDAPLRNAPYGKSMANHAEYYQAARNLMYDPAITAVFQFSSEDNQRYGGTDFGRSCMVARNAVRARNGTVYVNINSGGWDTHNNMFDRQYAPNMYTLANNLDRGLGMLVEDLKASGDFQRTLIVLMGEFGRSPSALNARGGRDHHKDAMSVLMLGGGVRGAKAIGSTDAEGRFVSVPGWSADRAIVVEDIAATIYSAMGINWTKSLTDTPSGRKFEYVPFGIQGTYTAIDEVFA
ncbi:MAG: DUF1501 domain-containing protein [Acidobacteria bacterium]|nr:DUF1501 domain-containing protein [Acidobacteriota bacterium]